MFVIRNEQLAEMTKAVRAPFHLRILAFLQKTMPDKVASLPARELLVQIAAADQQATRLGLRTERGITQYVSLAFMAGAKFDERPEVRAYFALPQADADAKIALLLQAMVEEKEKAIRQGFPDKLASAGKKLLGVLLAVCLAPFLSGVVPALALAGAAGGAAATGGTAAGAGALALLGPVGLGVLLVAATVLAVVVLHNELTKANEESQTVASTAAPTAQESCPESEKAAEQAPTARPPKTKADIEEGRQNIHKPGTNENKTRSESPKGEPTTWKDPTKADDLTVEAYEKGTITQTHPNGAPKEVKWKTEQPVGKNGETQITIKIKENGKMHGFPSGPKAGP